MTKKGIILFVISIIFIILFIILGSLLLNKKKEKINDSEVEVEPYVIENKIKIESPNKEITIPFIPYAKDSNKIPADIDGVAFDKAKGTYRFYDLNIGDTDQDGYTIYSFKYDLDVPITFSVDTTKNSLNNGWSRSYAFLQANVFDYYAGLLYKEKNETVSGNLVYHDINNASGDGLEYMDVTFNDKTYKIGVRNEISSTWDGIQLISTNGSINTYSDTNRVNVLVYVYAPADFDGLLVALNKKGTSKDIVLKQIDFNNKYNELVSEYEKSGEKTKELIKYENRLSNYYKLLDTNYYGISNTRNDFYVFRVTDISKQQ